MLHVAKARDTLLTILQIILTKCTTHLFQTSSECQYTVPLQPPEELPVFWPAHCRQPHPLVSMSAF